jgi:hypothetical protein
MTTLRPWLLCLLAGSVAASAQAPRVFTARLSTTPVEAANAATLTGSGAATATLTGNTLVVIGNFKGLQGAATAARLHVAPMGRRGPAMLDLAVTRASSGTISGNLTLTAIQVDHLTRNRVYVLLHSEKAPDGALWGWLLPEKEKK